MGIEVKEKKEGQELTEEEKKEKELEEEAQLLWELKDQLKKHVSTKIMKEMLDLNGQCSKGGEQTLLERCAYGMLFGALPGCPKDDCLDNFLIFSSGFYRCTGSNEWGKCTWSGTVEDVEVSEWQVPDDTEIAFLENYKFKPRKKLNYIIERKFKEIEKEEEKKEEIKEEEKKEEKMEEKEEPKGPFGGLKLCVSGKLSLTQKKLKELIESNGGKLVSTITKDCDYLISNEEDIQSESSKVELAKSNNVPILNEEFIHISIEKNKKLTEEEMKDLILFNPKKKREKKRKIEEEIEEKPENEIKKTKLTLKIKGRAAVDPDCEIADDVHVLEIGNDIYSVNLNMTDITSGVNSYYILQILKDDKKEEYYVFRKWGRLGTNIGNSKLDEFDNDKEKALKNFENIYLDKTGNEWEERKNFMKKPKKFYPVDVNYGNEQDTFSKLLKSSIIEYKGNLNNRVKDLMMLLFDVKQMMKTLIEMEIDVNKMPLGNLSQNTITLGFKALNEIENAIKNQQIDDLLKLTNKFYTIIPHVFDKEMPIINNEKILKEKIDMLSSLRDMETATTLMKENDQETNETIDNNYKKLNTNILPLNQDSEEYKMCEKYLLQTHGETHKNFSSEVLDVFKIERNGELEHFKPWKNDENRKLLWHGSRTTNFVGILSQGLRIAPPEAPCTGYMFGKGVYFADMCSKSAQYCRTTPDNNIGVMLLCEVALGKEYELKNAKYMDQPPKGTQSTKGLGKYIPDPKETIKLQDGIQVPLGKPVDSGVKSDLLYNEFIVYDTAQINIKYLLKVKFNYKFSY